MAHAWAPQRAHRRAKIGPLARKRYVNGYFKDKHGGELRRRNLDANASFDWVLRKKRPILVAGNGATTRAVPTP